MAVDLPLSDLNKRRALKEKTGFDVDKAIIHIEEERAEEAGTAAASTGRRVQPKTAAAPTGRRTESKYNVVKKEENKTEE